MTKIETVKWTALRSWGMLFRAVFISSLGIGGHFWLDPQPIGDVPFSQLTLNLVFSNLLALILSIVCLCWFFSFPKEKKKQEGPDDNPYVMWGFFGILLMLLFALIGLVATLIYAAWF